MSAPHVNPRRRGYKPAHPSTSTYPSPPLDTLSYPEHSTLRKGATFHSSKTPSNEDVDPILNISTIPRRSSTCLSALEESIAASERRMADLIRPLERSISGLAVDSQDTVRPPEALPVPKGLLEAHIPDSDLMDIDSTPSSKHQKASLAQPGCNHRHTSDSGLGSSIHSDAMSCAKGQGLRQGEQSLDMVSSWDTNMFLSDCAHEMQKLKHSFLKPSARPSAITRSITSTTDTPCQYQHVLSEYAVKQIRKHILIPILKEATLKNYHPLIQGIPNQINRKEITCLRDLEKVLIFLAPVSELPHIGVKGVGAHSLIRYLKRHSASPKSYRIFCEASIQCIHTTVEYLNERDQHLPTDRPYTNGYFLDLVEQIRQYAATMAASREQQAAGKELGENGYHENEKLTLQGGLHDTGKPAQLVRVRTDGKQIPLGNPKDFENIAGPSSSPMKRTFSEVSMDENVMQSMARRKKGVDPKSLRQTCKECNKEFDRPCDLTKHQKTHSRPWKCPETSCKYHTRGWPTEKERDRHVNDKHSAAPVLYKCHYTACTYSSKRESNCKQHMEKAHGYIYVRSKNNGKRPRKSTTSQSPATPSMSTPQTSEAATPVSIVTNSPAEMYMNYNGTYTFPESSSNNTTPFNGNLLDDPVFGFGDDTSHLGITLNFNEFYNSLANTDPNEYAAIDALSNPCLSIDTNSLPTTSPTLPSGFSSEAASTGEPVFPDDLTWNFPQDNSAFTTYNPQMLTPALSNDQTFPSPFSTNLSATSLPQGQQSLPSLSPAGQGNVMLYSPNQDTQPMATDEGFEDSTGGHGAPAGDFPLFNTGVTNGLSAETMDAFAFPPLQGNGGNVFFNDSPGGFDDIMGDY
ncbi:MAG: copper-binding transcription factor [Cirrosporium novae-zelandiae]|nr:MAG: copper-binding transcription factor [Cirrosporium novae-zelandiae]